MSALRDFSAYVQDTAPGGATNPAPAPASQTPPTPTSLGMRKDSAKDKQPNLDVHQIQLPDEPVTGPQTVTRAEVEKALTKFLQDLAAAQKHKDNVVTMKDKVWVAEATLHQGLGGVIFPKPGGDGRDYQAADLARMIAALLPDEIPKANYHKFLKLKAQDTALPGSLAEQLHKKYEETRDQIVSKLPKKLQKLAKEGMDLAVEKGVSYAADQALKAAGLPSDVEEGMKKVVDDYLKQVVEGESKEDK